MKATEDEIRALAENVLVVATYWLNFEHLRARTSNKFAPEPDPEQHLSRGAYLSERRKFLTFAFQASGNA